MQKFQTILFDVDGVLVDGSSPNPAFHHSWHIHMEADTGINPKALGDNFFKTIFNAVKVGQQPLEAAIHPVLTQLGCTISTEDFITYWLTHDANLSHPVWNFAQTLKAQTPYQLHLATNQEHRRASHLWQHMGFNQVFGHMFYSAQLGVEKSNPQFFQHITQELNLNPAETLLIDDDAQARSSAESQGYQTFAFTTPRESLPKLEKLLLS